MSKHSKNKRREKQKTKNKESGFEVTRMGYSAITSM